MSSASTTAKELNERIHSLKSMMSSLQNSPLSTHSSNGLMSSNNTSGVSISQNYQNTVPSSSNVRFSMSGFGSSVPSAGGSNLTPASSASMYHTNNNNMINSHQQHPQMMNQSLEMPTLSSTPSMMMMMDQLPSWSSLLIEDDEVKLLRENNQRMYSKIAQLQDSLNTYSAKLQFANEQLRDAEQKLRVTRVELDQEVDKRRMREREYQEEARNLHNQIEELQSQLELSEHKEKNLLESKEALEKINKDLERTNKEKNQLIAELNTVVVSKKTECEQHLDEVHQLKSQIANLSEELNEEKRNQQKSLENHRNILKDTQDKYEEKLTKLAKHIEKEKARHSQIMAHFKKQISDLEQQVALFDDLQQKNLALSSQFQNSAQREKFYKSKIDSLQIALNEQQTQTALMQQTLMHLSKEKENLLLSEKRLKDEIEDVNSLMESKAEKFNKEIQKLERTNVLQQQKILQLQSTITSMEAKLGKFESEKEIMLAQFGEQLFEKQEDLNALRRSFENAERDKQAQIDRLAKELDEKNVNLFNLNQAFKTKMSQYEEITESMKEQLEQQTNKESQAEAREEIFVKKLEEMQNRISFVEGENELLKEKLEQYNAIVERMNKLTEENELLQHHVNTLRVDNQSLRDTVDFYRGQNITSARQEDEMNRDTSLTYIEPVNNNSKLNDSAFLADDDDVEFQLNNEKSVGHDKIHHTILVNINKPSTEQDEEEEDNDAKSDAASSDSNELTRAMLDNDEEIGENTQEEDSEGSFAHVDDEEVDNEIEELTRPRKLTNLSPNSSSENYLTSQLSTLRKSVALSDDA
ncbi:hypothetical protein FDP41_013709 [Naegleria fowleri]|uniref:Uncharacterized protein n=1 Tax=Naegleria fowleri TaxID=5763 RepID=A0A6A5C4U6_NAEFO|nr:uncharacterized protein FDP41_013709 [Naegleria fowleri]KAF0980495.1 hypothetical protein FDP41_013709 [Naegleria fowleri]